MSDLLKFLEDKVLPNVTPGIYEQLQEKQFDLTSENQALLKNGFIFTHAQQDDIEEMKAVYAAAIEEFFQLTTCKLDRFMHENQIVLTGGVSLQFEDETRTEFNKFISDCLTGDPLFVGLLNAEEPKEGFGEKLVEISFGAHFTWDKEKSTGVVIYITAAQPFFLSDDGSGNYVGGDIIRPE